MENEMRLINANAYAYPGDLINEPTIDAVEVIHAHWEDGYGVDCYGNIAYKSIDCSHCNEIFKIESRTREYWKERFKKCPFCGAKMDKEKSL